MSKFGHGHPRDVMNTGRVWKIGNFQPICLWNDTAYSIDYDQLL